MPCLFVCLLSFFISFSPKGTAAERQVLRSIHVPAVVHQLIPLRRVDPEKRLKLAIGLPLRNESELDALLLRLQDSASQDYRRWLTPAQFTERFGPSEADYQSLENFAVAQGFTIFYRHPNRVVLDVEASARDIEAALHLHLQVYAHPNEQREFYAPDTEPTVDLPLPIVDISGLDNFSLPKPRHVVRPGGSPITPKAGSAGGAYIGNDFRKAYVPGNPLTGTGQSIGLLQFDGYYPSDIAAYESQAGLPNVPLVNVPIDGGVGTPGSGNSEVALDIEMVISMAPGISAVYVYEAPNPSPWVDLLSRMANDNLSRQLSCSWGGGGVNSSAETIFKQMSAQGQSFYNATGDSDAFTSTIPFPSDSTNITQVGGTTLTTDGSGNYVSEIVWNWGLQQGSYVGSSGGVSTYYHLPVYQLGISMAANQGSTTFRNVPDVALTGDNVYVRYNNGGSAVFGGTSCAAPLWAGYTALVNQQAALNGSSSIGFMNTAVYAIGKGANYTTCFHDTTSGNNFSSSSPTKYSAVTGYDLCTGWGTPVGNALINELAGPPQPVVALDSYTISAESCVNGFVDPGETVTLNIKLRNTGSANTTNLVATLQASGGVTSPSGAQNYGALPAGGAAVGKSFSLTAAGSCGGILTGTLQLQDGTSNLGTVQFMLNLGQLSTGVTLNEAFDGIAPPALPGGWTSALISGTQNSWQSSAGSFYTAPNAGFIADPAVAGVNGLVSPVFTIATTSPQLNFRHSYNLDKFTRGKNTTYHDGGVLEIKIGAAAFIDIIAAGGSFVNGDYNAAITTGSDNAYGGRNAWSGSSAGWTNVTVNLPAGIAGQNVQFRWVLATDTGNSITPTGWYVDSIALQDGVYSCCGGVGAVAPGITNQPTDRTVVTGQSTVFSVGVSGTPPFAYRWLFSGTNLPAQTNSTLILSNIQPANSGPYQVIVTNSAGSATSAVANLTVLVPPSFTLQPTNKTAIAGAATALNSAATGSAPLRFQWYFSNTNTVGTNGPNLGFATVQPTNQGSYQLVVTNAAGAATSSVATLTVLVPPAISLQPSNVTVIAGSTLVLQSSATGSAPLSYQWYFNGNIAVGTNGPALGIANVQPTNGGSYRLVVTNAAGSTTSSVASVTVLVRPAVTLQPSNLTLISGTSGVFQVVASGSAPLGYQWYFNNTNTTGTNGPVLGFSNAQPVDAGGYSVIVTNAAGSATSAVASLIVLVPPAITLQPSNLVIAAGSDATFLAAASGSAPLTFQWYFNDTNALTAFGQSLTISNVQPADTGTYALVVTNAAGSVTSSVVMLTIQSPPNPPLLLLPVMTSNGDFTFILSGDTGQVYAIEASSNVLDWEFIGTLSNAAGQTSFTETNASGWSHVYRARLVP